MYNIATFLTHYTLHVRVNTLCSSYQALKPHPAPRSQSLKVLKSTLTHLLLQHTKQEAGFTGSMLTKTPRSFIFPALSYLCIIQHFGLGRVRFKAENFFTFMEFKFHSPGVHLFVMAIRRGGIQTPRSLTHSLPSCYPKGEKEKKKNYGDKLRNAVSPKRQNR